MSAVLLFQRILSALSGHPFMERLLIASLELVVVTAVVLAVIHVARVRSNRIVSLLWMVALAKPVVSLLIGAPAPVWNPASLGPSPASESRVALRPVSGWVGDASVPAPPPIPNAPSAAPAVDAAGAAKAAWLTGVVLMLLLSVADRLRIRRLVAASTEPAPEIRAVYERAAGSPGRRRPPRLLVTSRLESPAIVGTLFPVVLLPAWMTRSRDRDRIYWSLRHELTHWRHRDPLAGFVGELSRVLFFFHPLVWWIGRRWKVAAEIACDQAMVATRHDARRYAEQLYHILTRVHSRRQIMLANGLFATRTQIGKRIELLLKSRPRSGAKRSVPALVFLAVFGALVFSLGAELSPQAEPGKVVVSSGEDSNESTVTTYLDTDDEGNETYVKMKGKVEFNDDRTDVVSISRDGSFTIGQVGGGAERNLKIESSDDGKLIYTYKVDGKERTFDDEAHKWLAEILQKLDLTERPDVIIGTKPRFKFRYPVGISDEDGSHVKLRIVDGRKLMDVYRFGGDDDAAIDIMMEKDDGDGNSVWITTTTDAVNRHGDLVTFDINQHGVVRIVVNKDGDKHELETKAGDGEEREYIYKLNGEVRPYDEKAKKVFEKYMSILEDGIELDIKGERI
jgi:beta-lactamase regulating signal transducer with metallopeptidase domain